MLTPGYERSTGPDIVTFYGDKENYFEFVLEALLPIGRRSTLTFEYSRRNSPGYGYWTRELATSNPLRPAWIDRQNWYSFSLRQWVSLASASRKHFKGEPTSLMRNPDGPTRSLLLQPHFSLGPTRYHKPRLFEIGMRMLLPVHSFITAQVEYALRYDNTALGEVLFVDWESPEKIAARLDPAVSHTFGFAIRLYIGWDDAYDKLKEWGKAHPMPRK